MSIQPNQASQAQDRTPEEEFQLAQAWLVDLYQRMGDTQDASLYGRLSDEELHKLCIDAGGVWAALREACKKRGMEML